MPLSTYAELQSAVADFLNRTDLAGTVPTFIALAEAQIGRDVRHWRMIERSAATLDARYVALPDDWLETVRLTIDATGVRALALWPLDRMAAARAEAADATGEPRAYAHVGGELELFPSPGGAYAGELVYFEAIPALSDASPVNWLLTRAPDVYLYGALLQAAPYLAADERVATWGALYAAAAQKLNETSDAARTSGSSLRMRMPR